MVLNVNPFASPREISSRSERERRSGGRGRVGRGRTPPDSCSQRCPADLDTPAAAAASLNVAPDARACQNRPRTSADFGRRPTRPPHHREVSIIHRCVHRLKAPPRPVQISTGVDTLASSASVRTVRPSWIQDERRRPRDRTPKRSVERDPSPRRDAVRSAAGQMREERVAGEARSARPTCALPWPRNSRLHLDQGGDENSDDAFPLVVPTGFEPVSPP
jgi:hypothetical protein